MNFIKTAVMGKATLRRWGRSLLVAAMVTGVTGCPEEEDPIVEADCYSPTQNLEIAYEEGAVGCACDPEVDEDVCVNNVALMCRDEVWISVEDGPCMSQEETCFSPTQNLDIAYEEGAVGCACDPAVDEDVCVNNVALLCRDELWISVEDGPCMP